jgi:hypothetical protein
MNEISRGDTMHDTKCKPDHETCVDSECPSGARNNYFVGKRLSPKSFELEQSYHIERRRLLNRAIHGWGIVYGFSITAEPRPGGQNAQQLVMGAGFALDQSGRELVFTPGKTLTFSDLYVPTLSEYKTGATPSQTCWVLSAHYAERPIEPVPLRDACSCERKEWNRTCETVVFCLRPCDPKQSDCARCPQDCDNCLHCDCPTCNKQTSRTERGPCACLCHAVIEHEAKIPEPSWHMCKDGTRVDLSAGVPLACVKIGADCEHWDVIGIEALCEARRFVKRNDLLFDLVRGCDLTYVKEVSWEKELHRKEVQFKVFAPYFTKHYAEDQKQPCKTDFYVTFSGPVQAETLQVGCVVMRVLFFSDGWYLVRHVPIVGFDLEEGNVARIVVDADWVHDKIHHRRDEIFRNRDWPVYVEIEIHGDYILDCCGQPIDANARGRLAAPGGNGTPGGTLFSRFIVKADDDGRGGRGTHSQA